MPAVAVALWGSSARAEDEKARRAREELERQLNQLVGEQPTKVKIEFEPLDEANFTLEDATFELDGKPIASPPAAKLQNAPQLVWTGDVKAGKHRVHANLVYANNASPLLSDEGGNKWKVGGDVSFEVNAGIEVQVRVVPLRDASQKEISKRVRLSLPAKPVMLARVDDASMPEPVAAKPTVAAAPAVVDAGRVEVVEKTVKTPVTPVALAKADRPPRSKIPKPVTSPPELTKATPAHTEAPEALVEAPAPAKAEPAPTAEPVTPPEPSAAAPVAEPVAQTPAVVDAGVAAPIATMPATSTEEPLGWGLIAVGGAIAAIGLVVLIARRRS